MAVQEVLNRGGVFLSSSMYSREALCGILQPVDLPNKRKLQLEIGYIVSSSSYQS